MNGTGPDFIGIGAARSGTTWIDTVLSRHPDVWLPRRKELHYLTRAARYPSPSFLEAPTFGGRVIGRGPDSNRFRRELVRALGRDVLDRSLANFAWDLRYFLGTHDDGYYARLFAGHEGKLTGEITPANALLDDADVQSLARQFPATKIIYIMRNPVDRAWSTICYHEMREGVPLTSMGIPIIEQYLSQPGITQRSQYSRVIERWRGAFGEERVFLAFYDEIRQAPEALVVRLLEFLGLSTENAAALVDRRPVNASVRKDIPPEVHAFLVEQYREEIEQLAALVDGYAASWLDAAV